MQKEKPLQLEFKNWLAYKTTISFNKQKITTKTK
jgi:hypothetical protein